MSESSEFFTTDKHGFYGYSQIKTGKSSVFIRLHLCLSVVKNNLFNPSLIFLTRS
jgi:hypothetical protein